MRREEEIPCVKHIAIFPKDQLKMVEFYQSTVGMKKVHQHDAYGDPGRQAHYLSDGYINLAILPARAERPGGIAEVPQDGRFAKGFSRYPSGTRVGLSQVGWLTEAVG